MTNRLFVYGTLAPGQSNAHVLADLVGTWEKASVNGTVYQVAWGPASGYPGILLNEDDGDAAGLIFSSDALPAHWERLDAFEGEGYTRVLVTARLQSGSTVQAFVYSLNECYTRLPMEVGPAISELK